MKAKNESEKVEKEKQVTTTLKKRQTNAKTNI